MDTGPRPARAHGQRRRRMECVAHALFGLTRGVRHASVRHQHRTGAGDGHLLAAQPLLGIAVLLLRTAPPIVLDLSAWTDRRDAPALRQHRAGVEGQLHAAVTGPIAPRPGATAHR